MSRSVNNTMNINSHSMNSTITSMSHRVVKFVGVWMDRWLPGQVDYVDIVV